MASLAWRARPSSSFVAASKLGISTAHNVLGGTSSSTRRRLMSSSSQRPTINMPSTPTKSWERGAKLVKNTDTSNQYLEHIRKTHDPALHLKTIEDELRGTMGKALGKQGEKILRYVKGMAQERQRYEELRANPNNACREELKKTVERHNDIRRLAVKARWELQVHRQAVGFIVDNHNTVARTFPIGGPLVLEEDNAGDAGEQKQQKNAEQAQKFGTQTDWWQKIGRWR